MQSRSFSGPRPGEGSVGRPAALRPVCGVFELVSREDMGRSSPRQKNGAVLRQKVKGLIIFFDWHSFASLSVLRTRNCLHDLGQGAELPGASTPVLTHSGLYRRLKMYTDVDHTALGKTSQLCLRNAK